MDLEPYFVFCLTFQLILGYSIWEPFCSEEKLYMPYVRVFKKGRNGAIVRDRGPGFIDLTGQKDIYVCTNGLYNLLWVTLPNMKSPGLFYLLYTFLQPEL